MTAPTLDELQEKLRHINAERVKLAEQEVQTRKMIDQIRLEDRPTYPTQEQIDNIRKAIDIIRSRRTPVSHLGEHVGPLVSVHGARGWMQVRTGAPYSSARRGERLWRLDDDEVERILAIVREEGFGVDVHWLNDGNLSLNVVLQ